MQQERTLPKRDDFEEYYTCTQRKSDICRPPIFCMHCLRVYISGRSNITYWTWVACRGTRAALPLGALHTKFDYFLFFPYSSVFS